MRRDYLINTGTGNPYFLLIVGLVTAIGGIFVFQILPAYDPSTLAQPFWLVWAEYLGLLLGGLGVFASLAPQDRIKGLKVQFWALLVQTVAIYLALATAMLFSLIAYGGLKAALFIMLWGITFSLMHTSQLFKLRRERGNAPQKREIGERLETVIESTGGGSDLMLQALLAMQRKNDELESRLTGG